MSDEERTIVLELTPEEAHHALNAMSQEVWAQSTAPEEYWKTYVRTLRDVRNRLWDELDKPSPSPR